MGKIFRTQTYLKIRLTLGIDLTDAADTEIHYVKPDGTTGELQATIEDIPEGIIFYDIPAGDESNPDETLIDQEGNWKFWGYVVFNDGRIARGETWKEKIYLETT